MKTETFEFAGLGGIDLPILLISGQDDPVGNGGKGVKAIYNRMKKSGMENVTLQLFPDARHDLLHEERALLKRPENLSRSGLSYEETDFSPSGGDDAHCLRARYRKRPGGSIYEYHSRGSQGNYGQPGGVCDSRCAGAG